MLDYPDDERMRIVMRPFTAGFILMPASMVIYTITCGDDTKNAAGKRVMATVDVSFQDASRLLSGRWLLKPVSASATGRETA